MMHERERETGIGSTLFAFLIGGLVGAGIALLMAPQSGDETRSMIRDKSQEIKDRATSTVDETRHRAGKAIEDLSHQTRDKVTSLRNRGQDKLEEQMSRMHDSGMAA
jgi:gas vesicle protein